jgi:hypothetical protein
MWYSQHLHHPVQEAVSDLKAAVSSAVHSHKPPLVACACLLLRRNEDYITNLQIALIIGYVQPGTQESLTGQYTAAAGYR